MAAAKRDCDGCGIRRLLRNMRIIRRRVPGKATQYEAETRLWCQDCREKNRGSFKIVHQVPA